MANMTIFCNNFKDADTILDIISSDAIKLIYA